MIKPLQGYVLIQPVDAEEKSVGGIILPQDSQEKPAKGKVIAVSSEAPVSLDQIVYFKKWATDEIKEEGIEYKFVKFEDLMGVVE